MSDWRGKELAAADRTIDRIGRQFTIMRTALEKIANGKSGDMRVARKAIEQCRKIDEELWKK